MAGVFILCTLFCPSLFFCSTLWRLPAGLPLCFFRARRVWFTVFARFKVWIFTNADEADFTRFLWTCHNFQITKRVKKQRYYSANSYLRIDLWVSYIKSIREKLTCRRFCSKSFLVKQHRQRGRPRLSRLFALKIWTLPHWKNWRG